MSRRRIFTTIGRDGDSPPDFSEPRPMRKHDSSTCGRGPTSSGSASKACLWSERPRQRCNRRPGEGQQEEIRSASRLRSWRAKTNPILGKSRRSENDGLEGIEREMTNDGLVEGLVEAIQSLRVEEEGTGRKDLGVSRRFDKRAWRSDRPISIA